MEDGEKMSFPPSDRQGPHLAGKQGREVGLPREETGLAQHLHENCLWEGHNLLIPRMHLQILKASLFNKTVTSFVASSLVHCGIILLVA